MQTFFAGQTAATTHIHAGLLPARGTGALVSSPVSLPSPSRRERGALRVMIVEDEALIAFDLEDGFRERGDEVAGPFSSCADALAALSSERPDLAIVDAVLSDGPCLELALELRRRDVPFFIYSGGSAFEKQPPELDSIHWLQKPAPIEAIFRAADALIAVAGHGRRRAS